MRFDNRHLSNYVRVAQMRIPRRHVEPFTRRWTASRPAMWMILIAANVGCFAAQSFLHYTNPGLIDHWLALSRDGLRAGYFWQFFTYMFLHEVPLPFHLLINMITLYFAGREVEAIVGPRHLLGLYFGGGLLGGIAQMIFEGNIPLVGASAGIFAVFIAFTTILPEIEITALLFFVIPIRLRAKYLALGLVGFSVVSAVIKFQSSIAHIAHLGGCLVGWLYIKQLGYGNPLRIQRYVFEKRRIAERRQRMSPAQFINEEIDPILDKISREGIHSLTRSERKILETGRDKIAKRTARS